jgi:hypothetical protein
MQSLPKRLVYIVVVDGLSDRPDTNESARQTINRLGLPGKIRSALETVLREHGETDKLSVRVL